MTFKGIVGQERVCRILEATLKAGQFPPLLFAGPAGVGKRTLAIRLAQAANCEAVKDGSPCGKCRSCRTIALLRHPDVRLIVPIPPKKKKRDTEAEETDGPLEGGVVQTTLEKSLDYAPDKNHPVPDPKHKIRIDIIRWVRAEVARPPMTARRRFFIFLHAHRMTREAASALLKTLEEPQKQTTYILTTDSPNNLLSTTRSRCRQVKFSPIPAGTIQEWLAERTDAEPDDIALAAQISDGSLGKALRFLKSPEEFLSGPVKEFFSLPVANEEMILSTMTRLHKTPLATVVSTFLFLYRQTLATKLGLESSYAMQEPAVRQKAEQLNTDYLRRAIKYLSGRLEDCRMYINRRLFLYTLLSSLRRPTK